MDLMELLAVIQQGQQQQLGMMQDRPMLKPRSGIPRAASAGPEWKIRSNPSYAPYDPRSDRNAGAVSPTGQPIRSWRDDKSPAIGRTGPNGFQAYGPNGPSPQGTQTPVAGPAQGAGSPKPQGGGGFVGMLKGLFGGDQQGGQSAAAPQGPRINSLTGLPFGTMPGDPAYEAQFRNAPKAVPVPGELPPTQPQQGSGYQRDPQIQNLVDLATAHNNFVALSGPQQSAPDQGFDPGPAPNIPFAPQQPQQQMPVQDIPGIPGMPNAPYPQPQPQQGQMQAQMPPAQGPYEAGISVRPGMQATNTLSLLNAPGMAATGAVNRTLLPAATYASNQLPQMYNAYQGALNTVGVGQKALQAGTITAGELAPAMSAASNAYNTMVGGANTAASTAKSLAGGQRIAGALAGGSRVAPILQGASRVAAPVQAGLIGVEAGRLALDPEYRQQATADYETLADQGPLSRIWQSMGAPVATIGNLGMDLYGLMNAYASANRRDMQNNRIQNNMRQERSPEYVKQRAMNAKKRRDNQ